MVKKKVKRKVSVSKAKPKVVSKSKSRSMPKYSNEKKMNLVGRRLVLFLILFALSLVFNAMVSDELWSDFFGMGTWIFGFISVALLLVLVILWFMKSLKK